MLCGPDSYILSAPPQRRHHRTLGPVVAWCEHHCYPHPDPGDPIEFRLGPLDRGVETASA